MLFLQKDPDAAGMQGITCCLQCNMVLKSCCCPPHCPLSQEIAEHKNIPSFWVDSAAHIDVDNNKLLHKTSWGELKETSSWLPDGPVTIAVTSGASTPDRAVEEVLDKVFKIKDPAFCGVAPKQCAPVATPTH